MSFPSATQSHNVLLPKTFHVIYSMDSTILKQTFTNSMTKAF